MKLLIPAPRPDETITSVLDRAASLYATTRGELAEELVRRVTHCRVILEGIDLDANPPHELTEALAEALGCTTGTIERLRVPESKWLLDSDRRVAYCPNCFDEDRVSTGSVYMRREWSFSFMTHCPRHKQPLMGSVRPKWKPGLSSTRDLMSKPRVGRPRHTDSFQLNSSQLYRVLQEERDRFTPAILALWQRLCEFEASLLADCLRRARRFDARTAFYRDLVMLFSANWGDIRMRPAMASLRPYEFGYGWPLYDGSKISDPDYDIHGVWAYFLAQRDPSWRRDVTWVLMQCGCAKGAVYIQLTSDGAAKRSATLAGIACAQWFKTCLDQLPEYGRWLARAFAARWPPPYRRIVEKLQPKPVHLDAEALNKLRVEAHQNFMQSVAAAVNATNRNLLAEATMEKLWASAARTLSPNATDLSI